MNYNNNYQGFKKKYINNCSNYNFQGQKSEEKHLDEKYKIKTYSDNGKINANLINEQAKELAEEFSKQKLANTQLRNFYGECLAYKDMEYEDLKIRLILLKAKLAYTKGRSAITQSFYEFMENRINCIKSKKDFEFFLMHFMTIIGYFKYFTKDKNK